MTILIEKELNNAPAQLVASFLCVPQSIRGEADKQSAEPGRGRCDGCTRYIRGVFDPRHDMNIHNDHRLILYETRMLGQ